ncbi:hypothetical protein [Actinophytocola algeriensis]|uniref:Uncharacterized protein n=1 Tax=Actinophytocola algeriensis TaxID=1768010 RepID=A0A7W7VJP6_9PSEU|nr:hypothetical protein [Actinophytocola algeriensis]MBB4912796.1 hypothetical protein [Actinophytocola algeriensis]MBE1473536.1 hypothetical protein [Actinophytocola algeriensis]
MYDDEALIVKAPDEQARRAVEDLFGEFARTGSAMKTVRASLSQGWRSSGNTLDIS